MGGNVVTPRPPPLRGGPSPQSSPWKGEGAHCGCACYLAGMANGANDFASTL